MANPVRIYVLHHPGSKLAGELTNRIYDWFRMPSLEGIPVYVRSAAAPGSDRPELPARQAGEPCLEYILPLVDAHMVRDPVWHGYLVELAKRCAESAQEPAPEWGWAMFPVALDSTAFNLPEGVARLNFIRHGTGMPRIVVVPGDPNESAQRQAKVAQQGDDTEETLKHLTEALARDLNGRLFAHQKAERFKIFISYARADSTSEAKALRNYIQSQTQCLVFFDENDIGFGQAFDQSIAENVGEYSKALIVLNSDHYGERPWCRWEINRFTQARKVPLKPGLAAETGPWVRVFHPVLVVDNMRGPKLTRVVPELAQAPVVRWEAGRERMCFSALMREVILGLRDVLEARTLEWGELTSAVVVNRLPGPVALMSLVPRDARATPETPFTVHHPGHGLPLSELRLLERAFESVRFQAFRDISRSLPPEMERAFSERDRAKLAGQPLPEPPLRGRVIALSTAHNAPDLASLGYLPQHQDEALMHLLRPLLRLGADLLYGGKPPRRDMETAPAESGLAERNITLTLMQLLSDERGGGDINPTPAPRAAAPAPGPLLFNISAWPACNKITEVDEAAWINACHVHRVLPLDAGLAPWTDAVPGENEPPTPGFRRYLALTFSRMRELLAGGFDCQVPGNLTRHVRPAAFVFIGGVTDKFKGGMPGVLEEFLSAALARPAIPIYLIGGLGGATGVIARALLDGKAKQPPLELTQQHYQSEQAPNHSEYRALLQELKKAEAAKVRKQFGDLWLVIKERQGRDGLDNLFDNGLNQEENRRLLSTPSTTEAVGLIWTGMSRVLLSDAQAATAPPPSPKKKSAPGRRASGN